MEAHFYWKCEFKKNIWIHGLRVKFTTMLKFVSHFLCQIFSCQIFQTCVRSFRHVSDLSDPKWKSEMKCCFLKVRHFENPALEVQSSTLLFSLYLIWSYFRVHLPTIIRVTSLFQKHPLLVIVNQKQLIFLLFLVYCFSISLT